MEKKAWRESYLVKLFKVLLFDPVNIMISVKHKGLILN